MRSITLGSRLHVAAFGALPLVPTDLSSMSSGLVKAVCQALFNVF